MRETVPVTKDSYCTIVLGGQEHKASPLSILEDFGAFASVVKAEAIRALRLAMKEEGQTGTLSEVKAMSTIAVGSIDIQTLLDHVNTPSGMKWLIERSVGYNDPDFSIERNVLMSEIDTAALEIIRFSGFLSSPSQDEGAEGASD